MTGAPKLRTMEIDRPPRGGPRGVYSGALGFRSVNGTADLSIVIRTLVASRRGTAIGSGGAIVAASEPDAEHDERRPIVNERRRSLCERHLRMDSLWAALHGNTIRSGREEEERLPDAPVRRALGINDASPESDTRGAL